MTTVSVGKRQFQIRTKAFALAAEDLKEAYLWARRQGIAGEEIQLSAKLDGGDFVTLNGQEYMIKRINRKTQVACVTKPIVG